jgi:beta-glucanase (GH16 family)
MVTTGRNTSDLSQAPRFTFQYGYAEIRARVPAGQGLWPAFWLLPATHKSKPEIDVMEILGDTPQITRMHVHYWDENGQRANDGQNWVGPDFSAGWHTFSVNWQANMIVWYVDGIERWRLTDVAAISHEPMYLLLNLAVGGDWPGAPDGTTMFPAVYEIDYVRVWQYRPSSARHEIFYCSLHCL